MSQRKQSQASNRAEEDTTTETTSKKILIIDDEEKLSRFVGICLKRLGFEVSICGSVGEAIDRLQIGEWSLVLTDLVMPDETGFTLLKWVKEHCPSLPVIVITAHSGAIVEQQIDQLGAVGLLHKPFTVDQLTQIVLKNIAD